jgi:hypothetical protein
VHIVIVRVVTKIITKALPIGICVGLLLDRRRPDVLAVKRGRRNVGSLGSIDKGVRKRLIIGHLKRLFHQGRLDFLQDTLAQVWTERRIKNVLEGKGWVAHG